MSARLIQGVVGLTGLLLGLAGAGGLWLQTEPGRDWLVRQVAVLLLPPDQTLGHGRIEGPLPLAATLHDLTVADRDGGFLTIDRLALTLDPWPLLRGRPTSRYSNSGDSCSA